MSVIAKSLVIDFAVQGWLKKHRITRDCIEKEHKTITLLTIVGS